MDLEKVKEKLKKFEKIKIRLAVLQDEKEKLLKELWQMGIKTQRDAEIFISEKKEEIAELEKESSKADKYIQSELDKI